MHSMPAVALSPNGKLSLYRVVKIAAVTDTRVIPYEINQFLESPPPDPLRFVWFFAHVK